MLKFLQFLLFTYLLGSYVAFAMPSCSESGLIPTAGIKLMPFKAVLGNQRGETTESYMHILKILFHYPQEAHVTNHPPDESAISLLCVCKTRQGNDKPLMPDSRVYKKIILKEDVLDRYRDEMTRQHKPEGLDKNERNEVLNILVKHPETRLKRISIETCKFQLNRLTVEEFSTIRGMLVGHYKVPQGINPVRYEADEDIKAFDDEFTKHFKETLNSEGINFLMSEKNGLTYQLL